MRRLCCTLGLCLFSAGLGVLLATFLPDEVLSCILAFFIVIAGLLILFSK